jgi:hypothetical protein
MLDPFMLLKLPVMTVLWMVRAVGWKVVLGGWAVAALAVMAYACSGR